MFETSIMSSASLMSAAHSGVSPATLSLSISSSVGSIANGSY